MAVRHAESIIALKSPQCRGYGGEAHPVPSAHFATATPLPFPVPGALRGNPHTCRPSCHTSRPEEEKEKEKSRKTNLLLHPNKQASAMNRKSHLNGNPTPRTAPHPSPWGSHPRAVRTSPTSRKAPPNPRSGGRAGPRPCGILPFRDARPMADRLPSFPGANDVRAIESGRRALIAAAPGERRTPHRTARLRIGTDHAQPPPRTPRLPAAQPPRAVPTREKDTASCSDP
jgi:hypothetical protein